MTHMPDLSRKVARLQHDCSAGRRSLARMFTYLALPVPQNASEHLIFGCWLIFKINIVDCTVLAETLHLHKA